MGGPLRPVRRVIEHPKRETRKLAGSLLRTAVGGRAEDDPPRDVWRWTAPKYRARTIALLMLNAVLFAGLGFFTFWLRTGAYGPFSEESYWTAWWEVFDPTNDTQITLIDLLVRPIPVDQVPMMIIILGLVLASLTAIPILVSMLYRFPLSLIFTVIVGFIAVFPWLAITVTFCCFLARWKPFRFQFRFATALLSLLPVVAYYALATRNASVADHLAPVELAKLYMPWVLALLLACIVMAIVLAVARLVNDRPGAIAPSMAVLFALPVVLFETKVRRDELYYRLLEAKYGPGSTSHFVDHLDASDTIERIVNRRLEAADNNVDREAMTEQVRFALQFQFESMRNDWEEEIRETEDTYAVQQYEAERDCERFRAHYPHSPYIPNVLFLEGRALDMRVDRALFRRKGILRHYEDFPSRMSKPTWTALVENYDSTPLASIALYRLALLEARDGRIDRAITLLRKLIDEFGQAKATASQPEPSMGWRQLLAKRPPSSALGVAPGEAALQGRKLLTLLESNRDPQQHDLALQTLLSLDPHHPMYVRNLRHMLAEVPTRYPRTALRDNLEVLVAAAEPSQSLRIADLEQCVSRLAQEPGSDAFPQARYELAVVYQSDNRLREARGVFETIIAQNKDSSWAVEAQRRLAEMGMGGNEGP